MVPLEKIVSLAKRRGFIYPGSEIYGGLANTYDYGPLGVELLRNIKSLWWDFFVHKTDNIVGLDASIISHQKIWQASGHTLGFADALIDCKNCKARMRADHLIEEYLEKNIQKFKDQTKKLESTSRSLSKSTIEKITKTGKVEGLSTDQLEEIINLNKIPCPTCTKFSWTAVRKFNQLFPVSLGIIEGDASLAYLRGETAQGIFTNFKNVVDSSRVSLPFGIAQIGKSFRNEITLGNSIFRTLEFEQAELEYFFDAEAEPWQKIFETWQKTMWTFVTKILGVDEKKLRWREHADEERSFYSKRTVDLEYEFPFGFKELWGLAYRTDYDLKQHMDASGADLTIADPQTGKKIVPHVIEPAVGINRLLLMIMADAYTEDERLILKLDSKLAPYKAAIFPLLANKPELVKKARAVYKDLRSDSLVVWDDRGNIGKRYFAQDEIGTPCCITIDFQTLEDDTVTIRDRDSAKQKRIKIVDLKKEIKL